AEHQVGATPVVFVVETSLQPDNLKETRERVGRAVAERAVFHPGFIETSFSLGGKGALAPVWPCHTTARSGPRDAAFSGRDAREKARPPDAGGRVAGKEAGGNPEAFTP